MSNNEKDDQIIPVQPDMVCNQVAIIGTVKEVVADEEATPVILNMVKNARIKLLKIDRMDSDIPKKVFHQMGIYPEVFSVNVNFIIYVDEDVGNLQVDYHEEKNPNVNIQKKVVGHP